MQDLMWEIETADGQSHSGTDCMPKPDVKARACVLRLAFPGCPDVREVQVPPGGRAILIRSTELLIEEGTDKIMGKKIDYKYGFEADGHKCIVQEEVRVMPKPRRIALLDRLLGARMETYRAYIVKDTDGRID